MSKLSRSDKKLYGRIHLPSSKSLSNRLLVLKFLHSSRIGINNLSSADDTVLMESLLQQVMDHVKEHSSKILTLHVENSGTTMRFLIALLSAVPGRFVIYGDASMNRRPVKILVDSLREIGADIQFLENAGYLPLFVKGRNLISRDVSVDASESSQHVSAILLIATAVSGGLNIHLENAIVSKPYIQMTCKVLEQCGFSAIWQEELIRVFPGKEMHVDIQVETDWSSAAFWYGMMALAEEGELFFPGLKRTGMQGDEIAIELFSLVGVRTVEKNEGIYITKGETTAGLVEWDFRDCPDLAVPFIVACALSGKRAVFRGLEGLRIKESDRIESLQTELRKLNSDLTPDYVGLWHLKPAKTKKKQIRIDSHADHRIAMAMTMITLKDILMEINDPEVVSKSYPGFWRDMQQAGFSIRK